MGEWNPQANDLYLRAIDLGSPEQRRALLDEACRGDASLRAQVESLIDAGERADTFLESPAPGLEPSDVLALAASLDRAGVGDGPESERLGSTIGRYTLLEKLGEGGMGVVFMAEQAEPVRRRVALKLIKPGMDSRQVIARFEAERQALAVMDHPGIAKVLDAGTAESGRPYFVMELVRGVPVTQYCDREHLAPRQRLELFVQVCRAVQHAHTKGVIHRDIKPTNVLVTAGDGAAVPKVIDFGVAKAVGQERLTEQTLFTQLAQMVGTPLYMSPEQAAPDGPDVDTRSDVYSLGVLLYELLTGTTPFDKERLRQATHDEVRRIIREEEPPRPSTRLGTLGDELATVSTSRGTDGRRLGQVVRGDLDWIVMKALEKDRARRYETASDFAADVRRYLADEPVQACPPSAWYRLRKLARRNKRALASAALLAVMLLATVVIQAANNRRVRRERDRTLAALRDAELGRRRAREALDQLSSDIIGDWLSRQATLTDGQRRVLELAMRRYEQFVREAGDAPEERFAMARAYWRVGDFRAQLGMREESDQAFARGVEAYASLAAQFPDEPKYASELAKTHINHSAALQRSGAVEESMAPCEAARVVLEQLTARYPGAPEYAIDLGGVYCNIAHVVRRGREPTASLAWYDRAIARLEPFRERTEPGLGYGRMFLSNALRGRAGLLEELGRTDEAVAAHEAALALREQMVARDATDLHYARELGESHHALASLHARLGRTQEALRAFDAAILVLGRLVADRPGVTMLVSDLESAHLDLAELHTRSGRHAEALRSYQTVCELYERLERANPGAAGHGIKLGGARCNLGIALRAAGDVEASLAVYRAAIDTLVPLAERESPPGRARLFLRNTHSARARALVDLGRHAEALEDLDRAVALDAGGEPSYRARRAAALARLGRHAEAAAAIDGIAAAKDLSPRAAYDAACAAAVGAVAAERDARLPPGARVALSTQFATRAVALLERAVEAGFDDAADMSRQTDLDPLRQRDDFKALLDRVVTNARTPRPPATTQSSPVAPPAR